MICTWPRVRLPMVEAASIGQVCQERSIFGRGRGQSKRARPVRTTRKNAASRRDMPSACWAGYRLLHAQLRWPNPLQIGVLRSGVRSAPCSTLLPGRAIIGSKRRKLVPRYAALLCCNCHIGNELRYPFVAASDVRPVHRLELGLGKQIRSGPFDQRLGPGLQPRIFLDQADRPDAVEEISAAGTAQTFIATAA